MTGEERERKMLEDQIARAKIEAEAAEKEAGPSELQKRDGEKISLNLFGNTPQLQSPAPGSSTTATEGESGQGQSSNGAVAGSAAADGPSKPAAMSLSFGSLPSAPTPITNPLKRPAPMNVFKSVKAPKSDRETDTGLGKQKQLSEVERLMKEDQARKARGGYQGQGPRRG